MDKFEIQYFARQNLINYSISIYINPYDAVEWEIFIVEKFIYFCIFLL